MIRKNFYSTLKLSTITILLLPLGACTSWFTGKTSEIKRLETLVQAAQKSADQAQETAQEAQRSAKFASDSIEEISSKTDTAQQTADKALNAVTQCCAKADRMFEKAMKK
ncbi:lipoprotein [Candidatus Nitrosoglobus terrae]|uniref:Lipoprotein n=1 Tax=Candidatus Nitrosoglobus terrae TaxID=1630141 RepID=A0A1Q2SLC0_9GAMM|nr:Lpp/OprI family alanine-zipper lipoprotein [Candidatus Nitrosoglobus terrae]BAW79945.1 lipoprotein [Candidatus Nitrosoglobus terrae]